MKELWEHKNSERLAAIIIYMYVCQLNGDYGQTNEILSNMETKLFLVLHVDHKPLNIKTTQWNWLKKHNSVYISQPISLSFYIQGFMIYVEYQKKLCLHIT